jgi:hypothetical protein
MRGGGGPEPGGSVVAAHMHRPADRRSAGHPGSTEAARDASLGVCDGMVALGRPARRLPNFARAGRDVVDLVGGGTLGFHCSWGRRSSAAAGT